MTAIGQGRRILVACSLAFACLSFAAPARAVPEQARSADAVVESTGVNVHLGFSGIYNDYGAWEPKLDALGVRYIRDGLTAGDVLQHARLNDLAASGIRANLLMGDPRNRYGNGTLPDLVNALKTEVRSAVVSVEGPNEWDTTSDSYPCDPIPQPGCWAFDLKAYQQQLYATVKADPALAGLAVVGPAFALGDRGLVGDLSPWLDYGNMHPYPGNRNPEWSLDPAGGDEFGRAAINSGQAPVIATETGYHNALQSTAGHRPVSERAAGIYAPRLVLDYFAQASAGGQTVKRTFFYELIDQGNSRSDKESSFGLLRNDLSEKPAYTSLKNLLTLLDDRGPAFHPGQVDFSLEGQTSDVRTLVLQKRNGDFWLALWRDVDVWDETSGGDLYPPERQVTLRLARPVASAVAYRPSVSANPYDSWRNTSTLQLSVPADVLLVRLGAAGSGSPGPPGACACSTNGREPNGSRPPSRKRAARQFSLDLGRTLRASRISIRWRAGHGRRYRISTSGGARKYRRAGVVRLKRNGSGAVRFRPRRVRCIQLVQVDRRSPALGPFTRRNVRVGGRRR